ncbi:MULTISPECIES: cupin domain-containing protein [unclassified Phaeobacter]|uniref:cupin domain-containing protein n=1 Tax=unclassified Phaeobacter TaxID=2621772 RepID=UPI003A895F81
MNYEPVPETVPFFEPLPANVAAGFVALLDDQPIEGGFDPTFGDVTWQTLICSTRANSKGLVVGVAKFPAHGVLHAHRHTPPEFYYCIAGSGVVTMDGVERMIEPGACVYIPSDIEHGVVAGADGLAFVYGFGEDSFAEIEYRFSANQDKPCMSHDTQVEMK